LKDDDPQVLSILNSLTQLSAVLKDGFKPYLEPIMARLMADANKDIDIAFEDAKETDQSEAHDKETGKTTLVFKMSGVEGQKKLKMNTTALELKINAVTII
jgi:hypothetical protein